MGYLKDTIKGISWVGAFRVVNRLLVFVKTAVLARLLLPVQFGVFGIATLAMGFLEIITETGINVFLVQENSDIGEYLDTAWVVSIIRGILITLLMLASAKFVAEFFNSPQSYPVLLVIALVPFLRGFINPSEIRFQKELRFDKEFWFLSASLLADCTISVVFALLTRSVWAFVWGFVAGVVLELILSWLVLKPRPKISFEWHKAKKVIDRGKWMTGASIFTYLFQNGDNAVVGRLLGAGPLGIYDVAYTISTLPISEVADVINRVTFPVFTKLGRDYQRVKDAFTKTFVVSGSLITLAGFFIFIFAKEIVFIVLGSNWAAAVPVIKVLSIIGVLRGITGIVMALFLAVNKQEYVTAVTTLGIIGLFIPIIPLTLKYGLIGTGIAVIIGSLIPLPLVAFYTRKIFVGLKQEK
jgi:O-antigen/teichoic acid export membrane protein